MCGRYYVEADDTMLEELRKIIEEINRKHVDTEIHAKMHTGEIAPTNYAPVVAESGPEIMKWGIPIYGSNQIAINARSETAASKPMFSAALKQRRIVIPTSGFYEWKHVGNKSTDKYLFRLPGQSILYLAGLQTNVARQDGKRENYFTILTTSANESMETYHNRMPVYVAAGERDAWIHDPASVSEIIFRPQPELSAVKVGVGGRVDNGGQLRFF